MTRKIILIVAASIILGLLFFLVKNKTKQYETAIVEKGTVTETVSVSGSIDGASQSTIYSKTTGIVGDIFVENGQIVEKGDQLFSITSTTTEEERKTAYANYLSSIAAQKSAEATKLTLQASLEDERKAILDAVTVQKKFNDELGTGKTYSQEEKDSVESAVTNARQSFTAMEKKYLDAESTIQSANAALTAARASYEATMDSIVTAPLGGTVVNLSVKKGDNTSASTPSSPGTELGTIADFSSFTTTVGINEANISKIKLGQNVSLTLDSMPDISYEGYVTKIDDIGKVDQGLVTYNVEIAFSQPDTSIKSGMTTEADIMTQQKENVLIIPVSALRIEGEAYYVDVLSSNRSVIKTPVTVGLKGSDVVEIQEGVKEGDTVIIPSQ